MAEIATQGGLRCGRCETRWTGVNRARCSADGCHRTFNGPDLFDKHRVDVRGEGTCLDPAGITAQPRQVKGQPRPDRTTDGERVMWETDGIWYGVPQPTARRGEALAAWREARKGAA